MRVVDTESGPGDGPGREDDLNADLYSCPKDRERVVVKRGEVGEGDGP